MYEVLTVHPSVTLSLRPLTSTSPPSSAYPPASVFVLAPPFSSRRPRRARGVHTLLLQDAFSLPETNQKCDSPANHCDSCGYIDNPPPFSFPFSLVPLSRVGEEGSERGVRDRYY